MQRVVGVGVMLSRSILILMALPPDPGLIAHARSGWELMNACASFEMSAMPFTIMRSRSGLRNWAVPPLAPHILRCYRPSRSSNRRGAPCCYMIGLAANRMWRRSSTIRTRASPNRAKETLESLRQTGDSNRPSLRSRQSCTVRNGHISMATAQPAAGQENLAIARVCEKNEHRWRQAAAEHSRGLFYAFTPSAPSKFFSRERCLIK